LSVARATEARKGGGRKPVWKEVEEQEAARLPNLARRAVARPRRRYAVVYDIEGPRVRLGIGWFLLALPALVIGPLTTALLYGLTAAIAAAQTARCWRKRRLPPSEGIAAAGAGLVTAGAVLGAGGLGLGLLAATGAALAAANADARSRNPVLADAGWTLQCALGPGVAAGSMVLLVRYEVGAAIALLLLVSAYEIGDYLVGSGGSSVLEGPAAGLAAIVVITFVISVLALPPFDFASAWIFGVLVGILAPAGQLLASALLPSAASPASGLRRLDSLLLAGPVWAVGVSGLV
jgi:hypothetical protein